MTCLNLEYIGVPDVLTTLRRVCSFTQKMDRADRFDRTISLTLLIHAVETARLARSELAVCPQFYIT